MRHHSMPESMGTRVLVWKTCRQSSPDPIMTTS